jgi:Spy/CpxP family protein refolding chaperone
MKKIIGLFLVAAIAGTSVNAQEIPERKSEHPRMMHKKGKHHRHGMDMKKLNLTEDQKEQFKLQRETFKKQMEELKKDENITVKEWKSRMETLRKENKAKMDGILTSEQKAQLEKSKTEQKAKMETMGKERGEKMKAALGLSAEQSAKLEANRKETSEKMKSIREDKSLSDEQKKEQVKELMKGNKEKMKTILTEEQLKKMQEMRQQKPGGDRKKHHDADKKTI